MGGCVSATSKVIPLESGGGEDGLALTTCCCFIGCYACQGEKVSNIVRRPSARRRAKEGVEKNWESFQKKYPRLAKLLARAHKAMGGRPRCHAY